MPGWIFVQKQFADHLKLAPAPRGVELLPDRRTSVPSAIFLKTCQIFALEDENESSIRVLPHEH